ncbi:DUF4124 domain-containing protein [Pseudoalteromonas viridis]|uniref:DUF4124 domain-containing protein n=1 Tax=Pseudoalteromonas viridis TaxID=339617 RepID=A0ABX7V9Q6_9GAMM|nr:DUF4124 domain-containing protein [Pseudoalteromonas viridis]
MRLYWVILCLVYSGSAVSDQKVYRWKDKNGNWVYSDVPKKGSEKVKLNTNMLTMPATDTSILAPNSTTPAVTYKAKITAPSDQQTLRENSGSVYVNGLVTPRFANGFQVQLFLNGKPAGPKQTSASFALRDLPRGEHKLQMKVFDDKGMLVAQSAVTTFFLHRASLLNR